MYSFSLFKKFTFVFIVFMLFVGASINAFASSEENDYVSYLIGKGYTIIESGTIRQAMKSDTGYMDLSEIGMPNIPSGVVGMKLADFDNDGQNEMLVILTEAITTDRFSGVDRESHILSALMLKKQNGAVVESGAIKFSYIYYDDEVMEIPVGYLSGYYDLFIKYVNGKYLIGAETLKWSDFWYDGYEFAFTSYEYINGSFNTVFEKYYAGNLFDDEYVERLELEIEAEIRRNGIDYTLFKRTLDNDKKLEIITTIEYDVESSNDADIRDIILGNEPGTPIVVIDIKIPSAIAINTVAQPGVKVTLNGVEVQFGDQQPIIENDRTLVPLRAIFEALGATVSWNEVNQSVTSYKGFTTVTMQIGSNIMTRNGVEIELDVPARLVNDRTMVPVRAVAESFGVDVRWDEDNQTVILTD